MERISQSPLAVYQSYLDRGELAYQWSPQASRAVFFPRVICPFTGSDRLEWRVSAGLGTVYATTVTHPREGAPYNVALIDCDEGFRLMSRVEEVAPEAVRIGMRVKFRVHRPAATSRPIRSSRPWRAPDGRAAARRRRDRRRRRIRSGRGRRGHERDRSDGAGDPPRARRLRARPARCRRADLRHRAKPHLGPGAGRVSRDFAGLYRHDDPRRLVLHVSCRACPGGVAARPVQGRGHRLWLDPAHDRAPPRLGARIQPLRDAVPAVPAVDRLRAGRLAPHAPVRHHARAIGRGRGGGAPMGAAEPGRLGKEAADDRRGAGGADGQLSVHGARHLPGDRWRRRGDHDRRRARPLAEKTAGLCARAAARRSPTPTFRACRT